MFDLLITIAVMLGIPGAIMVVLVLLGDKGDRVQTLPQDSTSESIARDCDY